MLHYQQQYVSTKLDTVTNQQSFSRIQKLCGGMHELKTSPFTITANSSYSTQTITCIDLYIHKNNHITKIHQHR